MRSKIKRIISSEKGVTNLITLLIVLPTLLFVTFSVVTYVAFIMRYSKLEAIHFRTLELIQQEGYLTDAIKQDAIDKLALIGFPKTTEYPKFITNVPDFAHRKLRNDVDNQIELTIIYPAPKLDTLFLLLSGNASPENDKVYIIKGYGRSEALE